MAHPVRGCWSVMSEVSFQDKFTNVFNVQNSPVLIQARSGLVLKLGATDYVLGHFLLLDASNESSSPVFKTDHENYIRLIRCLRSAADDLVIDDQPSVLHGFHGRLPCRIQPIDVFFKM